MNDKIIIGYASVALVVTAGIPYLLSVLANKTKPHLFTWVLWTLLTAVVAAAQFAGNAGPGAWATSLTACLFVVIVILAYTRGDRVFTRGDWITLAIGLTALPVWYITKSPMLAAVIATGIDVIAYYPTFRKFYARPHDEMILSYVLTNIKHVLSLLAMNEYTLTTVVYPAAVFITNTALISMLAWRRATLARQHS